MNSDLRYSVFEAFAGGLPDECPSGQANCVVKLALKHYGEEVHQVLEPEFAPKLYGCSRREGTTPTVYVMELLPLPTKFVGGWFTLFTLTGSFKELVTPQIYENIFAILNKIVARLQARGLVHGDLRSNNIMVKMAHSGKVADPVEIKVIDFEWAGPVGSARYPLRRNDNIGYPGKAGDLIGSNDDHLMVERLQASMSVE